LSRQIHPRHDDNRNAQQQSREKAYSLHGFCPPSENTPSRSCSGWSAAHVVSVSILLNGTLTLL
jgi:hypothetical protein